MSLGAPFRFLRGAAPLGHLVWWTSGPSSPPQAEVAPRWRRAALPPCQGELAAALGQLMRALAAVPVLDRSGVFWVAPDFDTQLEGLRELLTGFRGWELQAVRVRADPETRDALRTSARRALDQDLAGLGAELEALLARPRERPSLLVRRLDALDALRRQAELHARHLGLQHEGLAPRLDAWAGRIDAALCARIVA